ncbi:GIY-YIG nuclease family protein [Maribellus mangrovi]|uniref:GIY-YIG nuclease family protein n=1 Tax=Maribellus mangrovi TaxID=3133146 RepID=UPI00346170D4
MNRYIVYILQSELDDSYYIGFTSNLAQRLSYHNAGKSRYTSRKIPWKCVYIEEFKTRAEAMKREKFLLLNILKKNSSPSFNKRRAAITNKLDLIYRFNKTSSSYS